MKDPHLIMVVIGDDAGVLGDYPIHETFNSNPFSRSNSCAKG